MLDSRASVLLGSFEFPFLFHFHGELSLLDFDGVGGILYITG